MSTVKKNTTQARFAMLASLGEVVFYATDLANLWEISNKNTLHTTLKRYCQQGLLHRVYRGLYTIKPVEKVDPVLLGLRASHEFSYLSTESVLALNGIIQQNIPSITIVGPKSKRFSIAGNDYKVRQLADMYLFNPVGIKEKDGIRIATVERAIADLLYFNPKVFFDAGKNIDWEKVQQVQREIDYPITKQKHDIT